MSTPMASPTSTPDRAGAPCVYFDGGCPLCRAEIAGYQRAEGGDALRWVDVQACPPAELGADLDRPAALARLHVRRADGRLVQGAAAFAEIWSALPRWAWLARVARLPGVLPVLDLAYAAFLRVRPLWRRRLPTTSTPAHPASASTRDRAGDARLPTAAAIDSLPVALRRELRTDHAGETGAVMIYRGILAVARDPALRAFAAGHLATEERHLAAIEQVVPPRWRSRMLPLWRVSGWLTGALPACLGPRAVYATIESVETFVDHHYAEQVAAIDALLRAASTAAPGSGPAPGTAQDPRLATLSGLRALLEQCRADEVAHRDDAGARWDGRGGPTMRAWRRLVGQGSVVAVGICRHV